MSPTHARPCNGGERGGGDEQQRHRADRSRVRHVRSKGECRQCSNYLNLECRREAGDAVSLRNYRLLRTALVHAYNQATQNMIFQICHAFGLPALLFAHAVHLYTKQVRSHSPSRRMARREPYSFRLIPRLLLQTGQGG